MQEKMLQAMLLSEQAKLAWKNNNVDKAISLYEQAIVLDDRLLEAHVNLGFIHLEKKEFPKFLAAFEKADLIYNFPITDNISDDCVIVERLITQVDFFSDYKSGEELADEINKMSFLELSLILVTVRKADVLWEDGNLDSAIKFCHQLAINDNSRVNPYLTKLLIYLREYTDIFVDKLTSSSGIGSIDKEAVLAEILSKPSVIKMFLLREARRSESQLGQLFWEKRGGWLSPPARANAGTLNKINKLIQQFEDELNINSFTISEAIKLDPSRVELYYARQEEGTRLASLKYADLTRIILIKPTSENYFDRGVASFIVSFGPYSDMAGLACAMDDFATAIELDPLKIDAYEYQIQILEFIGKKDEAEQLKQMVLVGKQALTKAEKDRASYIYNAIESSSSEMRLPLCRYALNENTLLGALVKKDQKILKLLGEKLVKLDNLPFHEMDEEKDEKNLPNKSLFGTLFAKSSSQSSTTNNITMKDAKYSSVSKVGSKLKLPNLLASKNTNNKKNNISHSVNCNDEELTSVVPKQNQVARFFSKENSVETGKAKSKEKEKKHSVNSLGFNMSGEGL